MTTNVAKPARVAIIGASGTYGAGILARAEELGVEAVVVTRSPHKFKEVKPTTTVVEAQLDDEKKLREAFTGCAGVISALGDDRKKRPKTHSLPHAWNAMKAAGVTKYIGMGSGAMMMPGEKRGRFQRNVHAMLRVLKLFRVDLLEQNEWERNSLLRGDNGADGITWVLTRPVRPTKTPFVGAYVHKDERGPMDCSIYDHGDFCLYCVASNEWDNLAPHVSSGPQPSQTSGTAGILVPPPVPLLVALVLGLVLDYTVPFDLPFEAPLWTRSIAAVAGIVAGVLLIASAYRLFRRAGVDADPYRPTSGIISSGLYKYSRNPMYVGLILIYAGLAALFGGLWCWLLLPVAVLVLDFGVVRQEEAYLERRFGDAYRTYCNQVRRWL